MDRLFEEIYKLNRLIEIRDPGYELDKKDIAWLVKGPRVYGERSHAQVIAKHFPNTSHLGYGEDDEKWEFVRDGYLKIGWYGKRLYIHVNDISKTSNQDIIYYFVSALAKSRRVPQNASVYIYALKHETYHLEVTLLSTIKDILEDQLTKQVQRKLRETIQGRTNMDNRLFEEIYREAQLER